MVSAFTHTHTHTHTHTGTHAHVYLIPGMQLKNSGGENLGKFGEMNIIYQYLTHPNSKVAIS